MIDPKTAGFNVACQREEELINTTFAGVDNTYRLKAMEQRRDTLNAAAQALVDHEARLAALEARPSGPFGGTS